MNSSNNVPRWRSHTGNGKGLDIDGSHASALFLRDLLALFACLGEADCDSLFATFHLAAFAAATALGGTLLVAVHLAFDVLAGALGVFSLLGIFRHWASLGRNAVRRLAFRCHATDLQTD